MQSAARVQRHHRDHFALKSIGKWDAAPAGGLEAQAIVTRCGVFQYSYGNELRHPDDVFEKASLDSLKGAPVVIGHPGDVTGSNWRVLAMGFLGDDVHADGSNVAVTIRVADAATAEQVRLGNLVELSCGYSCFVTDESGSYDGIAYQTRQRGIRYNHVGMGPEGWGRAGPLVRIYTDSNGKEVTLPEWDEGSQYIAGMTAANISPVLGALATLMAAGVLPQAGAQTQTDGAGTPPPAPVTPPAVVQAPVPQVVAPIVQVDATARAELAVAQARIAEFEKAANEKKVADAAERTQALATLAGKHGVSTNATMNDRQIREATIAKLTPGVKVDGETDDYVRAVFDAAVRAADGAGGTGAGTALEQISGVKSDGAGAPKGDEFIGASIEVARRKQATDAKDAWKKPGPMGSGVRRAG